MNNTTDRERVVLDEDENTVAVDSQSSRITTLAQLIRACKIDLKIWEIERHVINKWEVGAKVPDEFGGFTVLVEPLFQVKAWMIRKVPVSVHPVLQPVRVKVPDPQILPATRYDGWRTALFWTDPHFGFERDLQSGQLTPFHDRRALDVVVQICQRWHFDEIIIGGDVADLADWTDKFIRSPEFTSTTQPGVIETAWWLARVRQAKPNAKIYLIEGNHDYRMRSALIMHLLAAYKLRPANALNVESVLSVPYLLGLDGLGIEWVEGYPDNRVWLSDRLCMEHGDIARKGFGATSRAKLDEGPRSVVFGHIHRVELLSARVNDRSGPWQKWAGSPGCTCRVDGAVPGHRSSQGWQQGVMVVQYDGKGRQQMTVVPIWEGRAVYRGVEIRARDVGEGLRKLGTETGWGF